LVKIDDPSASLRRMFRFRTLGNGGTSGDEAIAKAARLQQELNGLGASHEIGDEETQGLHALYFRMFHSLEHEQLAKLLRGLDMVVTQRLQGAAVDGAATVRTLLSEMFPTVRRDDELLHRVHVELHEEEQCNTLLQVQFTQLSTLVSFLRSHLSSQAYIFARVPFKLKEKWGDDVIVALDSIERTYDQRASEGDPPLASAAAMLEAGIVDYEHIFSSDPEVPLHEFMVTALGSEQVLYDELPLMRVLPGKIAARHYVELRKVLHHWAHRPTAAAPTAEKWSWPFFFSSQEVITTSEVSPERSKDVASRWVLWFETSSDLVDTDASAQVRGWLDGLISHLIVADRQTKLLTSTATFLQLRWRCVQSRRQYKAEQAAALAAREAAERALAQLKSASDDELPGAIAAARSHMRASAELRELLPMKQNQVAEIARARSELRWKTLQRYTATAAVAFAVVAICIPLLKSWLSASRAATEFLPLERTMETSSATAVVDLGPFDDSQSLSEGLPSLDISIQLDEQAHAVEQAQGDVAEESAGASPDIVDAEREKGWPTPVQQMTIAESRTATPPAVPNSAIPTQATTQATLAVIGKDKMVDLTILSFAFITVAIASWLVARRRRNVRDRLNDLVALRKAGLVSEQNYLEREREILRDI